jgi:hypothetical protein
MKMITSVDVVVFLFFFLICSRKKKTMMINDAHCRLFLLLTPFHSSPRKTTLARFLNPKYVVFVNVHHFDYMIKFEKKQKKLKN